MALPSFGPRPPFSATSGRNEKAANGGGLSILTKPAMSPIGTLRQFAAPKNLVPLR